MIVNDVIVVGDYDPREREHLRRALFWKGFGLLGAGCLVHPSADPTATFGRLPPAGRPAGGDVAIGAAQNLGSFRG